MRLRFAVSTLLLGVALLSGCISHTRHLPKDQVLLKADTMKKPALLEKLKSNSLSIQTLKVSKSTLKASHILSGEAIKDFIGTGGIIVVERPGNIFLEIEKFGTTVVDMVADNKQYKVSIPHLKSGRYGVGKIGEAPETVEFPYSLRPSHILDALFVDGEQYMGVAGITTVLKETTESQPNGVHSYYVVEFQKGEIPLEDLWVDRTDIGMPVTRKIKYKEDGRVEADIRYSDFQIFNSIWFPKTVVINRRIENYSLEMKFESVELNSRVESAAFDLPRPPGAVDFDVNTGKVIEHQ